MNYAILTLEKEKQVLETALKSWTTSAKLEYATSYEGHLNELKDLTKAIQLLKNNRHD